MFTWFLFALECINLTTLIGKLILANNIIAFSTQSLKYSSGPKWCLEEIFAFKVIVYSASCHVCFWLYPPEMRDVDHNGRLRGAVRQRSTTCCQTDGCSAVHKSSQNPPRALPTEHDQPAAGDRHFRNHSIRPQRIFSCCNISFSLQDLFFKFSWNNFLHVQVEHCVSAILNQTTQKLQDSPDQTPQDHLESTHTHPSDTHADCSDGYDMFTHSDLIKHVCMTLRWCRLMHLD